MISVKRAILATLFWLVGMTICAAQSGEALARALEAARAENWSAADIAARPGGRVVRDVVEWHRLRASIGTFDDYADFLARNPDWPGLPLLRRRGEGALRDDTPSEVVFAYFAEQPPQSGEGALQLARAYRQVGKGGDADAELVLAWHTLPMGEDARETFLRDHARLLEGHHEARLDMLLWRDLRREARGLIPRVSDGWQKLARARMALRDDADGVDELIAAVPAALQDDPGLAFERFLWRARRGRHESAAELALERSSNAENLGEPDRWGNERRVIVRQLMRDGKAQLAYDLAASHHIAEGRNHADLEWLAGYIALTKLNDAARARTHFQRFRVAVFTPISLGRAGYWQGRAEEALGNAEAARAAYAFGAEFQTSFYGLLAAERAGLPMDETLTGQEDFPDWRQAEFMQSSVLEAGLTLLEAGELTLAERFLTHLTESLNRTEIGQLGDLVLSLDQPHLAVMIGKRAAQAGITVPHAYYPIHPLAARDLPVPAELALAIARRESEFDPVVISPVGARGLMQLMPRTAEAMSSELEIEYRLDGLTADPDYNVTLGAKYLAHLTEEFGPSYVLVAAGYNAGPSRPTRWMSLFGDPRSEGVDPVDWIEHIPFRETRNYVMRVMESLPVYRARLTGETAPIRLSEELHATR